MQDVPFAVTQVLEGLWKGGHEAFLVGGCVRDQLLGREINDWDVTTSALPEQVTACFAKVIPTGIAHGTVTVVVSNEAVEVTTYRVDGAYSDGRRPESVTFTPCLEEDLARRDFTINAMAYNPMQNHIVDPFGGQADLSAGLIRAVGTAQARLEEDGLRSFRAARFASQLGFDIDQELRDAMSSTRQVFARVSAERMFVELKKTVCSPQPEKGLGILRDTGLLSIILGEPSLSADADFTFKGIDSTLWVRLSLLLWRLDIASLPVAQRLKFPKALTGAIERALAALRLPAPNDAEGLFRQLSMLGREAWDPWLLLVKAVDSDKWGHYQRVLSGLDNDRIDSTPLQVRDMALTGSDLITTFSLMPGQKIGLILTHLLEGVWRGEPNERAHLLSYAKKWLEAQEQAP